METRLEPRWNISFVYIHYFLLLCLVVRKVFIKPTYYMTCFCDHIIYIKKNKNNTDGMTKLTLLTIETSLQQQWDTKITSGMLMLGREAALFSCYRKHKCVLMGHQVIPGMKI